MSSEKCLAPSSLPHSDVSSIAVSVPSELDRGFLVRRHVLNNELSSDVTIALGLGGSLSTLLSNIILCTFRHYTDKILTLINVVFVFFSWIVIYELNTFIN